MHSFDVFPWFQVVWYVELCAPRQGTPHPPQPPSSHSFSKQSLRLVAGVSEPLGTSPVCETGERQIPGWHKLKLNLSTKA